MGGCCCEHLLCWTAPVVWRAARLGRLEQEDVPPLPCELTAEALSTRVRDAWKCELEASHRRGRGRPPKLVRVIRQVLKYDLFVKTLVAGTLNGLLSSVARPLLLRFLIVNAEDNEVAIPLVAVLTLGLLLEGLTIALARHSVADRFGVALVATLNDLMFRKSMRLNAASRRAATALVGNDIPRAFEVLKQLAWLANAIPGLLGGIVVLLAVVGYVSLVGIAVFACLLTVNALLTRAVKATERGLMKAGETRIGMVSRIINGIRAIKLSAWEPEFLEQVTHTRAKECSYLRRFRLLNVMILQLGRCSSVMAYGAVFLVMGLREDLKAADVFTALVVFQSIRANLIILPAGFAMVLQTLVTMQRVQEFLLEPEASELSQVEMDAAIAFEDAVYQWPDSGHPTRDAAEGKEKAGEGEGEVAGDAASVAEARAKEIFKIRLPSLVLPTGQSLAVLGKVGSGKTSLLSALLGDLSCIQGSASLKLGLNVAYVMQKAFIIQGTIEENILMGRAHDRARLSKAVAGASLNTDLEMMPAGLETEIGERGVTLSGGQQQRVAIARALYTASPALLLFDDPLAAVDAKVAGSILAAVLSRCKSEGDSVVMALNQLALVDQFEQVAVLEHGELVQQGKPEALLSQAGPLRALLDEARQGEVKAVHEAEEALPQIPKSATRGAGKLVAEEQRVRGGIKASVFFQYLQSMGLGYAVVVLLMGCIGFASLALSDRWLAAWIAAEDGDNDLNLSTEEYAIVYAGSMVSYMLFTICASVGLSLLAVRASQNLHDACMTRLLHAPVSWFEETPAGRIISRLSTDLSLVDMQLGTFTDHTFTFWATTLQLTTIISIVVPPMLPIMAVTLVVYVCGLFALERGSRELKRLANTAQSPVLSLVHEAVQGRLLLRVMGLDTNFERRFNEYLDTVRTYSYCQSSALNWGILVSYLASTSIFTFSAILLLSGSTRDEKSMLGLGLGYSLQMPYFMLQGCFVFVTFRGLLTSLERMLECKGDGVPQEAPWHLPTDDKLPAEWPRGSVVFEKAALRYRPDLEPALKSVDFSVVAGEKIGVVGRTGAGKSSLVQLLFRLRDPCGGMVKVDGQDVMAIGLHKLRRSMAVIPQESLLLEGTVRDNIDPFHRHEDAELEGALSMVGFPPKLLNQMVGSHGRALSHGQHQLLALARALLRQATMVILDEPTSSIDAATDLKVQQALRAAFEGRTVFTIAHRLATIIDSDRILVMSAGEVAEFGTPVELYEKSGGLFSTMAKATGVDPPQSDVAVLSV